MSQHDVSSLSSSEDIHDYRGTTAVQLDQENRPQHTLLRRVSTAATSFFTLLSLEQQSLVDREEAGYLDIGDHHQDILGHALLTETLHRHATTGTDLEEFPQAYSGDIATGALPGASAPAVTPRRKSTIATTIHTVTKKFGFWDKDFHAERIKIVVTFAENYFWLIIGLLITLCIYWGAYYKRTTRYPNLDFAVIIADTDVGQLPAIVGPVVEAFFTQVPAVHRLGTFHIWNHTRISDLAQSHNNTISQEVYRQIHHQKYWAAFYVKPNATLEWFQALQAESTDFVPRSLMELVYETGRDYNAVNNYVSGVASRIVAAFDSFAPRTPLISSMLQSLSPEKRVSVLTNAPQLITSLPSFVIHDLIPITNQIVQAPFQIGMIYLVMFTFFTFIFTIEIQMYIATKVKGLKFILVKILATQAAYVVLSLAFLLLNLAFGLKFNVTFGYLGFLVVWSFGFLLMSSLGSFIEIFALLVGSFKMQLPGFVLLFVAVLNVAPTVSPMELCPKFFRYGHAMPVRNAYALFHVAYFDAWKGTVGLNIGVLCAWIVVTNAAMPFAMKYLYEKTKKQAALKQKEADASAEAPKAETSKLEASG
ncbi:uncharacterized protein CANTADRAFT_53519 [Suhomyces tanzawaensis NRRL Y-17324]|uniref:DUF3533 domain-containing protein n=1 Tax=Suhomyces tanzawaensis NRRL Y-17324 TaxID=984487 RepID=A0A1E4SFT1_9ASCO|nr:uncharacterized protein CANTADRAFT_53519 [Suhomyces tanzawaensis NRRL Y-17324]ODV78336.1 hypothetical protein CANTADRAFT_53519 [Suhomyces tanzawaensis NRRL Y-17324]